MLASSYVLSCRGLEDLNKNLEEVKVDLGHVENMSQDIKRIQNVQVLQDQVFLSLSFSTRRRSETTRENYIRISMTSMTN